MMNVDLIEQPIDTKRYHIYNIDNLPKCFVGIRVKNKFDQDRLSIKPKYKPKHIAHFKTDGQLEPIFLYGVEIRVKPQYVSLLDEINNAPPFSSGPTTDQCINWYTKKLDEFNLSCNTCYRYLSDGIYPVDISHLSDISQKDLTSEINAGFKNMVQKNDNISWYINLMNFNLFILTKSTGYKTEYTV